MSNKKHTLKIEFDNEEALTHFTSWLRESGEQDYWEWMEVRETEEDGDITVVKFLHYPDGLCFLDENEIVAICGRLDSDI